MPCRRAHSAGFGPVSPVKMNAPRLATGAPCTANPTAGTVCSAGSTSMRRSPSVMVWPISNGTSCSIGDSADGRRVKSGQITPLKMCLRSASIVAGSACTWIGTRSRRMRITLSASRPIDRMWSRCEWLIRMWSISLSSSSDRSPTPVPASINTSVSSKNAVVRLVPPIEPEQPRTRICMAAVVGAVLMRLDGN